MQTATKVLESIQRSAESVDKSKPQRFSEAASVGDCFRQGDIYIEKLDKIPNDCIQQDETTVQLAPGNTQGSRHILDSDDGVAMYLINNASPLEGPVFSTTKERVVTHPEHGHVILPPGIYGITYQRAYAEELKRIID